VTLASQDRYRKWVDTELVGDTVKAAGRPTPVPVRAPPVGPLTASQDHRAVSVPLTPVSDGMSRSSAGSCRSSSRLYPSSSATRPE